MDAANLPEPVGAAPTHLVPFHNLDVVDLGGVQRDRALHPDPRYYLAHRHHCARAGARNPEHEPLKRLEAFPDPFGDLLVDADHVPWPELWDVAFLVGLKGVDEIVHTHDCSSPFRRSRMMATAALTER